MILRNHTKGIRFKATSSAAGLAVIPLPLPEAVYIPLSQHVGEPCTPMVSLGDPVKVGQLIGDSAEWLSAPVHASVSGEVVGVENGVIVIATDGMQETAETVRPPLIETRADFLAAVRASGAVGLGGGAFPTAVKFAADEGSVDTFIVNGMECEPFANCDHQAMIGSGAEILAGLEHCLRWLGIPRGVIAVGSDMPDAVAALMALCGNENNIDIITLPQIFPFGSERVLCRELTGREIPEDRRPADMGVLVCNVSTLLRLSQYISTGMPFVTQSVTVEGNVIVKPQNLEVPIGTRISDLLDFCGLTEAPAKIVVGGPMTGRTAVNADIPIVKGDSCVFCFDKVSSEPLPAGPCFNCGLCMESCPMDLMPQTLDKAFTHGRIDLLEAGGVGLCIECGCCAYICPARIPLTDHFREAKRLLRAREKEGGGAE